MTTNPIRRLTWLLFFGQSIGAAAFIAGHTVAALVGQQLSGQAALAGVPSALYLLASASAAYPAARLMERFGRRRGLALGHALGLIGALIAGGAVLLHTFTLFLAGFSVMGAARGFTELARYAAADMYPAEGRARAISLVVLGGTAGAVLGPALVPPMGAWAESLRVDPLAGPWFASAALFAVGSLMIGSFLRPDPSQFSDPSNHDTAVRPKSAVRSWRTVVAQPRAQAAIGALVLGQVVMVMIMVITSVHMRAHGHDLAAISLVITAHTLGMFAPSVISGRLADRWGRPQTIIAGAAVLCLAALLAPLSTSTLNLTIALLLLGVGWNFCYVAGGALLTDALTPVERLRGQGVTNWLVGLVSAGGSIGSSLLYAALGYTALGWLGLTAALIPLALALRILGTPTQAKDRMAWKPEA